MHAMILKFAASARAAGMRISTAEVLDCLNLLPEVDILDEAQFAALLRSHFAKSRLERLRFDYLYRLFFHELREDLELAAAPLAQPMAQLLQDLVSAEPRAPATAAVAEFLGARPEAYLQLLNDLRNEADGAATAPRGLAANAGGLVRRLQVLAALHRAGDGLERFLESQRTRLPWETRRQLHDLVDRRLATARRLLSADGVPKLPEVTWKKPVADSFGELGRRTFTALSPAELVLVRDAINQLVRKLKDAVGRRNRARSRGVVDMKRTLRTAARTQGVPMSLKFRQKPPRKGRIVVLCDVSGSVWSSARFMLTMLYALQDCFDRVRSFVFIDEPIEVTRFFDAYDVDRALAEILECKDIEYGAATDYGRMLRRFKQMHLDVITKKTTLILIGDGRSNYGNPEAGIFETLRERSRRLYWLNPETEHFWYSGDSEMRTYETFCNEVHPCQNLNQLNDFVRRLVL